MENGLIFDFLLSIVNEWEDEVFCDEDNEYELADELYLLVMLKYVGQCCINLDLDHIPYW